MDRFKITILLFLSVIYATHICGLCPAGFFYKGCLNNSSPICDRCPEGTFKVGLNGLRHCTKCRNCLARNTIVVSQCNATHDTECRCRDGYYFDKEISQCSRCSKCIGKNNVVVRECHGTQNTECRCKDGYYFDTGALYCSRCGNCKRGQGVVKNCTSTSNTQCARCVRGLSFSPVRSRTEPCRSCKICGRNEQIEKECSRKRDTVCKPLPQNKIKNFKLQNKSKWPEPFTNKTTNGPKQISSTELAKTTDAGIESPTSYIVGAKKRTATKKNSSALSSVELGLIIAGGLLVLIIIVTVIIVVFRWRRNKTNTAGSTTTTIVKTPPPSYPHHTKPREAEINRLSRTPLMPTGSTELLRNANFLLIEELSTYLNPNKRWKCLAGKLGYKSKDIENFDLEPATEATEKMLRDWSHQMDSTVQRLFEVLASMKWSHEADVVYKYMNSP